MTRVKAMVVKLIKLVKSGKTVDRGVILKEHPGILDCLTQIREATADTIEAVR